MAQFGAHIDRHLILKIKQRFLLKNIIVLAITALLGIANAAEPCGQLEVAGIYQSNMKFMSLPDGRKVPTGYLYLRFLPDQKVISVVSIGSPDEVRRWFKSDYASAHPVPYRMEGIMVSFVDKLPKGSIEYAGELVNCTLNLRTHSTITGHEDHLVFSYRPD